MRTWLALFCLALTAAAPAVAAERFPHDDWTQVLARFVDAGGMVDYQGLARDRADLDRYLARIEARSPRSHPPLFPSRDERLAYWLNAYNAQVVQGVLARGPERDSVWKGGLISGKAFFEDMDIVLGGEKMSLKSLEDDIVRREFQDPRIHAALNCASKGCPRLPQRAFDPERLDAELDAAMREFVGEARNCDVDRAARTVTLSEIFDWFEGDFLDFENRQGTRDPNVLDYVNRYRPVDTQVPRDFKIKFFEYDKKINQQP
jgi:hypothetical protein